MKYNLIPQNLFPLEHTISYIATAQRHLSTITQGLRDKIMLFDMTISRPYVAVSNTVI